MALCPTCGQARGGKQGHGKFGTDQAVPDWSNRPELDSNDGAGGLVGRDPIDTKVKQFSSSLYNIYSGYYYSPFPLLAPVSSLVYASAIATLHTPTSSACLVLLCCCCCCCWANII